MRQVDGQSILMAILCLRLCCVCLAQVTEWSHLMVGEDKTDGFVVLFSGVDFRLPHHDAFTGDCPAGSSPLWWCSLVCVCLRSAAWSRAHMRGAGGQKRGNKWVEVARASPRAQPHFPSCHARVAL